MRKGEGEQILFFLIVADLFRYGTLKLPLTCMEKIEKLHLLLCQCRYFDKSTVEMCLDKYSIKYRKFMQISQFGWLPWPKKGH